MCEIRVVDPLHNENINFVTEQSAKYQYVHVPSRYYVFDTLIEDEPLEGPRTYLGVLKIPQCITMVAI